MIETKQIQEILDYTHDLERALIALIEDKLREWRIKLIHEAAGKEQ